MSQPTQRIKRMDTWIGTGVVVYYYALAVALFMMGR